MKYLTNSGLSYFLNKIKTYIASQLNSKASVIHTHTKSDIIDLPNGYVVDSTLDGTSSNAVSNSAVVDALDGKSNTGHTHTKSEITDFPTLATVATSGSYNDLTNKPTTMTPKSHTHGNITNTGAIGTTANKPLITTTNGVITTGSFGTTANTFCQGNDSRLSDARAPTVHTHSASDITSGLATVATSGSYNDLDDRPTIPTVNNATLKIQKNGTDIKTFTANASSNVTCNITVPTKTSDLTNDSGFLTSHQSLSNYSTLANTVKSLSISGKTITVTPGSGDAYTLTTQDTVYTHPTTAGNKHVPSGGSSGQFLGWDSAGTAKWVNNPNSDTKNTAGSTDTSSKIFLIGATSQAANPQTYSHDTAYVGTDGCLYSGGTKVLTAHQSLSNYSTLANTIKSLSISGKTITYTKGDNSTGTLTTQDSNTWTAMKGATSSANGSVGYVNAVPPKDGYNTKYLRADGTWQVPPDHTYTVNNATLTIQKNGTTVKTFTANASSNVTCNITVPTKVSELTNDSGFLTSHQSLSSRVPVSGGAVMTGDLLGRTVNNSYLVFSGGIGWDYGANVSLFGKDSAENAGVCLIRVRDNTNDTTTAFYPSGSIIFGSNFAFNTDSTFRIGSTSGLYSLFRYDGVIWNNSNRFIPLSNLEIDLGLGGNAWKNCFLLNAPVVVSDARAKTQVQDVDDKLLDAWENVSPKTFKMVSAVEKKGEQARYHTGYIAQDIQKACTDNNIDATRYGLFCFDSWDEQPEVTEDVEVEKDGVKTTETRIVQEKRAKGDSYSLRYEEALVVECAYLRRENSRLKEKLANLEERLEKLENQEK